MWKRIAGVFAFAGMVLLAVLQYTLRKKDAAVDSMRTAKARADAEKKARQQEKTIRQAEKIARKGAKNALRELEKERQAGDRSGGLSNDRLRRMDDED